MNDYRKLRDSLEENLSGLIADDLDVKYVVSDLIDSLVDDEVISEAMGYGLRPVQCCGACPPVGDGGYDCTCLYSEVCETSRVIANCIQRNRGWLGLPMSRRKKDRLLRQAHDELNAVNERRNAWRPTSSTQ